MALQVNTKPLVGKGVATGPGIGNAARTLRGTNQTWAGEVASALEAIQARLDRSDSVLRNNSPTVDQIVVTDAAGQVIGAIGEFIFNGVPTTNYFSEIHVGDPLNTRDPSQALFNANSDGSVTIGQNGWLDVLDPFGADAAWIGTQYDTQAVTVAANNGSGLIRLTVVGHTLSTGDSVRVLDVGGVVNATGVFTVTKIGANTFDLQNSVWAGAYTSGGTVDRLLHISAVANNGSGLARITTAVAHGYESGDRVNLQGVGSGLNAQWTITVIDTTHFDLVGSTYTGGTNGTCLRYFAGGLFQTIAVAGTTFANAKLRALADGTLKIRNATITLNGAGGASIILDPSVPSFVLNDNVGFEVDISPAANGIIVKGTGTATWQSFVGTNSIRILNRNGQANVILNSNTSINDGRISVFDSIGTETFAVLGQAGDCIASGLVRCGGNTLPSYALDATGDVNASGVYRVAGVAGVSAIPSLLAGLTVSTQTIQYKDWAGVNQSALLVNGITQLSASMTFTGGIRTV